MCRLVLAADHRSHEEQEGRQDRQLSHVTLLTKSPDHCLDTPSCIVPPGPPSSSQKPKQRSDRAFRATGPRPRQPGSQDGRGNTGIQPARRTSVATVPRCGLGYPEERIELWKLIYLGLTGRGIFSSSAAPRRSPGLVGNMRYGTPGSGAVGWADGSGGCIGGGSIGVCGTGSWLIACNQAPFGRVVAVRRPVAEARFAAALGEGQGLGGGVGEQQRGGGRSHKTGTLGDPDEHGPSSRVWPSELPTLGS